MGFPDTYSTALPATASIALKEWSVAVQALARGRQVLIIRKGGIREEGRHFRVTHPTFLFYPTFEHQQLELLKPGLDKGSALPDGPRDPMTPVQLTHYAEVHKAFPVSELEELRALSPHHIWSDDYAEKRLRWKPRHPLTAMVLRVYELETPRTLQVMPEYIGCRSWVALAAPVALGALSAVLSDEAFAHEAAAIDRALASIAVASPG